MPSNLATKRVNVPRVHMAGSDAHSDAHIEVGQHGFALFLSPNAEHPDVDIDGTRTQLDDVVEATESRACVPAREITRGVVVTEASRVIAGHDFDRQSPYTGRRIVSAIITRGPGPLPWGVFDQAPRVIARLDDGQDVELFSFYAHERSFAPEQFLGLTVGEGRRLKFAPANRLDMRQRSAL